MEKPWYKSKKLWACVLGCGVVLAHNLLGLPEDQLNKIAGMIMVYIAGQGVADIGKQLK